MRTVNGRLGHHERGGRYRVVVDATTDSSAALAGLAGRRREPASSRGRPPGEARLNSGAKPARAAAANANAAQSGRVADVIRMNGNHKTSSTLHDKRANA